MLVRFSRRAVHVAEMYLTCNVLLVSQYFCIEVLQSDGLNFWCAWLRCVVAAAITSVVFNTNFVLCGNL